MRSDPRTTEPLSGPNEGMSSPRVKPSKCVFYVFITSVYAHAFNSIDFPVTSH